MFTYTPQDFQSVYDELQYRFVTTSETDITFNIKDSVSDELYGVKKFYSSADSRLNVAPLLRPFVECSAPPAESGFMDLPKCGCVSVVVEACGGESVIETSDPLRFSLSHNTESFDTLLTTMEPQRLISHSESDMITMVVRPEDSVVAEVVYYAKSADGADVAADIETFSVTPDDRCVVAFNLHLDRSTTDDGEPISKIVVSVSQLWREIAAVTYYVVEKPAMSSRVAWVSSRGSVEHYSFAEVVACEQWVGGCELTLASAFETYQMREAIAEVVAASQVWLCTDEGYKPVKVVSKSVDTTPLREIAVVEIKVECGR